MAYVQAPDKFIFTANPCPVAVGGLGTSETVKFTVQDWEGGANLVELYLIAKSGTVSVDIGDVLSRLSYFSQNTSPIIATSLGTSRAVLIKFTNTAGSTVHYSAIHYLVNGGKQLGNDNTYFGSGYAVKWLTEIERPIRRQLVVPDQRKSRAVFRYYATSFNQRHVTHPKGVSCA